MEGTKGKEANAEAFRSPRIFRKFMSRFFANDSEHSNDQLIRILKSEETVSGTIRKHAMIALEAQLPALMTGSNISCAGGENLMVLLNVIQRAILSLKTSNHPNSLAFVEALLQFYLLHLVSLLTSNIRGSGTVPAFLPLLEDSDPLHLHLVRFTAKILQKFMDYSSSAVSIFKELGAVELLAQRLQMEVHWVIGLADDSDSSMIIGGSSEDQLYSQEWLITASLKELGFASYTAGNGLEVETFPLIFGNVVVKFGGDIYHSVMTTLNESIHNPNCFSHNMSLPHAIISLVVAGVLPSSKALQCIFNGLGPVCLDANGLEAVKDRSVIQMNGAIVLLANAVEKLLWHASWLRSIGVDIKIEISTFTDNNTAGKANGIESSAAMDMQSEDKEQHLVDSAADGISNDQFIKLSIFHLMVLVHTTMENAEICQFLVEKSGTHTLLKLLLQPCVVQSCDGMSISVTSISVFKDFTQNHSAAFASALKKKLSGVDVVSSPFLLEPRMSLDGRIRSGGNNNFSKEVSRHGTCISIIRLPSGIVIGIDSRSVSTWLLPTAAGHQRSIKTLLSDENPKLILLANGVYITLCGSERRMANMLTYVRKEINSLSHDRRITLGDFDIVCSIVCHYFRMIPKLKDEVDCYIHILGWHSHEQNYAVCLVIEGKMWRVNEFYDGIGSGYPFAFQAFDWKKMNENMEINTAVEEMWKGLVQAAICDLQTGGRLQVHALINEGKVLDTKYNRHLISELEETSLLNSERLKQKTIWIIVEKQYEHILTPADLMNQLNLKYQKNSEDPNKVAVVDWLGVVESKWLVYQVVFNEDGVASQWYSTCPIWKKPMRRLQFSVAESSCTCYVALASRTLAGRIRTMHTLEDLQSPYK